MSLKDLLDRCENPQHRILITAAYEQGKADAAAANEDYTPGSGEVGK